MAIELPLYEHRRGDAGPLPAVLRLDLRDNSWNGCARGVGDGVPMVEWHGHILAFSVPFNLTQAGIDSITGNAKVKALVARVIAGYASEWDGSNEVATLTDDASSAVAELEREIERLGADADGAAVWAVGDWLDGSSGRCGDGQYRVGDHVLTPATADAELASWAQEFEADAEADGVYLEGDVEEYLRDRRERLTEEEAS